jgi:hypothetical protein
MVGHSACSVEAMRMTNYNGGARLRKTRWFYQGLGRFKTTSDIGLKKLAEPFVDPHGSWPNHDIEERLGTLSGPSLPLRFESLRALVKMFGLSGASPTKLRPHNCAVNCGRISSASPTKP